ncbi:MAG: chorismate synthase [Christensenellales bacterium]|jgi:chorismate synthase|nr:chorismate synthase [Clostridiales bacterium]
MKSVWGKNIIISIFGESHGEAVGATIHGLPCGFKLDLGAIQAFMDRRKPGGRLATKRKESDIPRIISGIKDGVTTGAPLTALIMNEDMRSSDYDDMACLARPSHADYAAFVKYGGHNDIRGGGHFSGRLTAPLVFAGAVCEQMLNEKGVYIGARLKSVGKVEDDGFDCADWDKDTLLSLRQKDFPTISEEKAELMKEEIQKAAADGDSIGGVVECVVIGLKAGVGEPMFEGVENRLASIIFGIPAVKGIEFGGGFSSARMKGSEHNDELYAENGEIKTYANNDGGITGGITNGMPVIFRAAIKPTPSIAKPQRTVDLRTGKNTVLRVKGRHDPCVALRAVPCIEAAACAAVFDMLNERR